MRDFRPECRGARLDEKPVQRDQRATAASAEKSPHDLEHNAHDDGHDHHRRDRDKHACALALDPDVSGEPPEPVEQTGHVQQSGAGQRKTDEDQYDARDTFRLGCELAALTHGHPTGQLTAGVLAVMVRELADGASLSEALAVAKPLLREERDHHETLRALELAEDLAAGNLPSETAIARLGEGWIAEEALASSLYCALVASDFRHGVSIAVNHDGDSVSTGSLTGSLLGTLYGVDAIPQQWLEPLELREVIAEIEEDLHDCIEWPLSPFGSASEMEAYLWPKYPGH